LARFPRQVARSARPAQRAPVERPPRPALLRPCLWFWWNCPDHGQRHAPLLQRAGHRPGALQVMPPPAGCRSESCGEATPPSWLTKQLLARGLRPLLPGESTAPLQLASPSGPHLSPVTWLARARSRQSLYGSEASQLGLRQLLAKERGRTAWARHSLLFYWRVSRGSTSTTVRFAWNSSF